MQPKRVGRPSKPEHLTPSEIEAIRAVLAGHTTDAKLCTVLNLKRSSLATHFNRIYRKCGVVNRVELVLMCLGRIDAPDFVRAIEW